MKLRQMEQVESQRQKWVEWFKVILEKIFLGDLLKQSWLNKTKRNTLQTRNLFALQWFSQGFSSSLSNSLFESCFGFKTFRQHHRLRRFCQQTVSKWWMSNAKKWVYMVILDEESKGIGRSLSIETARVSNTLQCITERNITICKRKQTITQLTFTEGLGGEKLPQQK